MKQKVLILLLVAFFGLLAIFSFQKSKQLKPDFSPQTSFRPQPPSLDQIFADNHSWVATLSAEKITTLITTGDVMLGRAINYKSVREKNFTWMWEKTVDILQKADLVIINLESPLVENCPPTNEGMKFCADLQNIESLKFAGVDVINLANNHIGNYGLEGIKTTVNLLNQAGILVAGTDKPAAKNLRGLRFAFLGYNDFSSPAGISQAKKEKIQTEITQAKNQADIVVVTFHWGVEYTSRPTQKQQNLAHLAIDSGADLIIGHHPHWIQPIEIYKDKIIVYSHGNFIFDQPWSQKTSQGIVGHFTFYDKTLIDAEFLPIQINRFGQPDFLTNGE